MDLVRKGINYVKKNCDDDEVCIMIVFVVIGFMLCYLFKNQISGYMNFATVEHEFDPLNDVVKGAAPIDQQPKVIQDTDNNKIGIELKPRNSEPTPSTMKQMAVMASKPPIKNDTLKQEPGLNIQEASIFRPFDEVWNPGFMPLDMVFKGAKPSVMAGDRPMGPKPPVMGMGMGPKPPAMGMGMGPKPPAMGMGMGPKPPPMGGGGPSGEDVNLVLLYAPWCGHSKRMLPDYERIKSEYDGKTINGKKINIIMYDSDVDKDKVKEYGVRGFPSLFFEKNGNRESFPHREYEKIKSFLENL